MSGALRVEPASGGDAPAIAALCRDEIEAGFAWQWRAGAIARLMSRPDTELAVARIPGGTLAGFGALELGSDDGELILFGVDPRFRRRGVGTAVLEFLAAEATHAGLESLWLHVRVRNAAAVNFYERLGFRIRDHLDGHYGGHEDAFRMQRRLAETPEEPIEVPDLGALLRGS
ncbi:MAG: GNAT family N-acetyltransferase [Myxococcota bacterium]